LAREKEICMADNTEKDPRDWVSGDDPMTGAQASYLKTLCEQAHMGEPGKDLTKAEASDLINRLREKVGLEQRHQATNKESLQKQADRAENIANQTVDDQLKETLEEAAKEYRKDAESSRQPEGARPRGKSPG
jgi:hypothetical protein